MIKNVFCNHKIIAKNGHKGFFPWKKDTRRLKKYFEFQNQIKQAINCNPNK
jgi:hypothetical protein